MKNLPKPVYFTGFPALKVLILITGISLAACTWYVFANWLRDDGDIAWFTPDANCNLHTSTCSAVLGDKGRLTLTVDADGRIDALDILPLDVEVEGLNPSHVTVDFIGRDMDMGLHRFGLTATAPGHFHGQGQVGICTQDVMPWRARVILETPEGKLGSWFDFDVIRS
ncbi:hypothetical protein ACN06F_17620 [Vreelandella sp. 21]|uniref:Uncharacterized protein n=1 Tax=Vreelandella alkaliphila TaxID=272774 RepID=A0AAJ2RWQ7_9GAMM|nr:MULTISPECIES: hypothetical protein [Halomonas]AIA74313.1 hypothetical protein FF32_05480 [Halomonas campaniensis]MCD6005039.1 hypothetical protein [Halomonas sp. IOP_6]MCD6438902.1 hypothetical protein [Halomonas sp.]MDX5977854.1 hypothetical protein [Halomonas alkaliphila]